jgi:8-oxo-dGTP pyrophosphatase MutT (NUDIX family)
MKIKEIITERKKKSRRKNLKKYYYTGYGYYGLTGSDSSGDGGGGGESVYEDDSDHQQQLQKTGFWGRQGAGCLFLAMDTKRLCINHRSRQVEEPGTWGTWGGAIDSGENPEVALKREVREEAGYNGKMKLVPLYVFKHSSGFTYYNYLALVETEFTPVMDWETQGFKWVEYGKWPKPLHPGLKLLLNDPASLSTIQKYTK